MSPILTALVADALASQTCPRNEGSLQNRCKAALEHARRLSAVYEEGQIEIALAWETVEELEKAQSHYQVPRLSNFELYCLANPDAPEARIYDV